MAAESNTPVDIEIWIEKVINSCETLTHRTRARRLVNIYIRRLEQEGMPYYQYVHIRNKFEALLDKQYADIKEKNE